MSAQVNASSLSTSPLFAFEGIPIHPSHGLALDSPVGSPPSELDIELLSLDSSPHSTRSSDTSSTTSPRSPSTDFFMYISSSADIDNAGSPISSAGSTPTRDSPLAKRGALPDAHANLPSSPLPLSPPTYPLPGIRGGFAHLERAHHHSHNSPHAALPPPPAAASMMRAYSMPVLTQRQMDEQTSLRGAIQAALESQAPTATEMARRSTCSGDGRRRVGPAALSAALVMESTPSSGLGMTVPSGHLPFSFDIEPDWGIDLPQLTVASKPSAPYPYNLQAPRPHPAKFLRSHSTTDIPKKQRRGSSPLGPLTPILPVSSTLLAVPVSPSRPTGRLHRGVSFS